MTIPVSNSVALLTDVDNENGTFAEEFVSGLAQGSSWDFGAGPRILTYSLNINDNGYFAGDPNLAPGPGGTWEASPAMAAAVTQALAAWASVANIGFQQITSGTYAFESGAELAITLTGDDLQGIGAIGLSFFPDPAYVNGVIDADPSDDLNRTTYPQPEGDVYLDNYHAAFSYLSPGGTGLTIILHELGHALGLKHTMDDGANFRPTFDALGVYLYDSMQYTVMSGTLAGLAQSPSSHGFAATPMPADILAIQHIYGANLSYHAGDDVYTLADDGVLKTIWDAGGTDTFDASALTMPVALDLHAGAFSSHTSISGPLGAISTAIAYNVTIENAIGGSGSDAIAGNDAANQLTGGNGNDAISGFAGDDTLDGGIGADSLTGGAGSDTYTVDDIGDVVAEGSDEGTDTVISSVAFSIVSLSYLENVTLVGSASVNVTGNALDNALTGNSGANRLRGNGGLDTLAGGAGDDTYIVDNAGQSVIEGVGQGNDLVQSAVSFALGADVESLVLTGGDNTNGTGNGGGNAISGNDGSNVLDGGAGADTLSGGGGDDIYVVDNAGDMTREALLSTVLASTTANDTQTTGFSYLGSLSDDGHFVAFQSYGNDLTPGAISFDLQIFVKDLQGGGITRASVTAEGTPGNSNSSFVSLSADGRYAAFESLANNLAADDTNNASDVFVKDLLTGSLTRASSGSDGTPGNSWSGSPDLSADGRYVVFYSNSSNLVAGDGAGADIFIKDLQAGATYLVSTRSDGTPANGGSQRAMISADNRYVVFQSDATNLVDGDTNVAQDLFRKDLLTGETVLVSSDSSGALPTLVSNPGYLQLNGSWLGGISGDGRYVVFNSVADNLVAGDTNGQPDVFVKDLLTGATTRVSTASDGSQANDGSNGCGISADGRFVVFDSIATNLATGDTDSTFDAFIKDLQTGVTVLVSGPATGVKSGGGSGYSLSADGRYVTFDSFASNLVAGDTNGQGDVFVSQNPLADPGGMDEVQSGVSRVLGAYIERLTLTGSGGISGAGNGLDNLIVGNGGDNTLDGGAGTDTLDGGAGTDTASYSTSAFAVAVDLAAGTAADGTGTDVLSSIENVTGSAHGDHIAGDSNPNVLVGGGGIDSLIGGAGDDTEVVSVTGTSGVLGIVYVPDVVSENLGEGIDTVLSSSSYTLAPNIENLTLIGAPFWRAYIGSGNELDNIITGQGAARHQLYGNGGNDTLIGGTGSDTLVGGAGNDSMAGGSGNDIYSVDSPGDGVVENAAAGTDLVQSAVSYTLGANVENLTLAGTLGVNGTGNGLNNVLTGNSGINNLNGGAGDDTMSGGAGNDTYVVDSTLDVVQENASEGTDLVQSAVSYTLGANAENLTLTGTLGINATGNSLNNTLTGNSGNNVLDGAAGADTMFGGLGNDTYIVDNAGDVVAENSSAGTDLVQASVTYTLAGNIENLTLIGSGNINGTGNALGNVVTGNSGNNILSGAGGNDTLIGGAGDDTLVYDAADGRVDGGAETLADVLGISGSGVTLNLTSLSGTTLQNFEAVDLTGTGNNTLTLTAAQLLALSSTSDTLRVDGNAGDVVNAGSGWTTGGDQVIGLNTYHSYTQGLASLLVDTDVTQNVLP